LLGSQSNGSPRLLCQRVGPARRLEIWVHGSRHVCGLVNEDTFVEELPDRPLSGHPNLVTGRGLTLIEAASRTWRSADQWRPRKTGKGRARSTLLECARRATAQVVSPASGTDNVQFGNKVTIASDDGREQTFRIVGEDEVDPAKGSISHVSPLARALPGKSVGDMVRAGKDEAEITAIE
jgi:transcription elongation GreA/GreB family factor